MEVDRSELIKELRTLRQRQGVTLAQLELCPQLNAVFGHPAQPATTIKVGLLKAINELEDGQLLRNAYGIGEQVGSPGWPLRSLQQRREAIASDREVSVETIEKWEDEAIQDLAILLLERARQNPPVDDDQAQSL